MSTPPMTPLYFGPAQRPLFGWLHQPSTAPAVGLVICNPFGYESVCTHRTVRTLADRAADAGIAALRFDYDGTGDSAGLDTDPGRLDAWLASIGHAVDELRTRSGVTTVCLLGIRLGALLAAVAAARGLPVQGLIAMAPVVNGRQYARELRALALAGVQSEPPAGTQVVPGMQESAGYALPEELRNDLGTIDLAKQEPAPLRHALILERSDMPSNGAWATRLSQAGTVVDTQPFDGYVPMMLDPHEGVVPQQAVESVLQWLAALAAAAPAANAALEPARGPVSATMHFEHAGADHTLRETPLIIDGEARLFGIVTEPEGASDSTPRNIALMLNSGGQPHSGPGRLYVRLARRCASVGMTAVRVDLAGLGDSGSHAQENGNVVYSRFAQDDVRSIVEALHQRYPGSRISSLGICSGAYHGLKAAVAGVPLAAAVVVNPLTFFWKDGMTLATPEFQVTAEANRYKSTAFRLSSWLKILKGQVNVLGVARILGRRIATVGGHQVREAARWLRIPLRDDLASELRSAAKHGATLHFVFSESDPGLSMLHEQGGLAVKDLQRRGLLSIDVMSGADHTFTPRWTQEKLLDLIGSLIARGLRS